MDRLHVIARLKAHEVELREMGLMSLSMFGSTARGDQHADSDVDLAATFDHGKKVAGFFRFVAIQDRLREVLGVSVDLVGEPARKDRVQAQIDRDRIRVF